MIPAYSAAAERNQQPILNVLSGIFPEEGTFLEVASGTGQHGDYFTEQMPNWIWQPTDANPESLASIQAYQQDQPRPNFLPPFVLDVTHVEGQPVPVDGVFCANMIHISPWESTRGLMELAAQVLRPGAALALYGPFREEGVPTASSNEDFDAYLKSQDARWGLRSLAKVREIAEAAGLEWGNRTALPANNLLVSWKKPE